MFQSHFHSHRPVITAHVTGTMKLLELNAGELHQEIQSQLSNPALEYLEEERRCPTCHRLLVGRNPCPLCSRQQGNAEEPIVFVSPRDDFYTGKDSSGEEMPEDNYSTEVEDLPTYVLRQIALELSPEERKIAAFLLTNLDDDGFLVIDLEDAVRYLHFPLARIEKVQHIIQKADPVGVGSSSARQALLIQLETLRESVKVPELAEAAVIDGLELLSRRQYAELAHLLKAPIAKVKQAATFIHENLNPYPARSHWGESQKSAAPNNNQVYYQPDILINRSGSDPKSPLMVEIIMPLGGTLRVNPLYRVAIHEADGEKKEMLKEDLERASLFVKCIQQRNHTMQLLMHRVAAMQRDFILYGEKNLKPVTRAQIAEELEVHESTISRAVSSKAVQLPSGRIIPLADFFDRSLGVRTVLREIVSQEKRPLSDSDLVEMLKKQGYCVARRTVAKYRAMEGILSASMRQPAT